MKGGGLQDLQGNLPATFHIYFQRLTSGKELIKGEEIGKK